MTFATNDKVALNIRDVPAELMKAIKSKAASDGSTLRHWVLHALETAADFKPAEAPKEQPEPTPELRIKDEPESAPAVVMPLQSAMERLMKYGIGKR